MSIRRSNFKILGLVLVLYLYIYAPPLRILPINISSIIGAMGCLFFLVRPQKVRLLLHFKWELLILFAMFLYALVLYPVALSPEFLTPFTIAAFKFPFAIWVALQVGRLSGIENDRYDLLLKILIVAALIACLISFILWSNIDLSNNIKFNFLKYDEELMRYQSHRAFGFSDELLFSFSLVQAAIFAAALFRYGWSRYIFVFFVLISASILLNARIGFVFIFLAIVLNLKPRNVLFSFSLLMAAYFLATSTDYAMDAKQGESVLFQVSQIVRDLNLYDNQDGVLQELFGNMFFFPDTILGIFFGEGVKVFGETSGSDSGYINAIFFGGLFYLTLIFAFFLRCYFRLVASGFKVLALFLFLLFLIASFKGQFFIPKPGMNLFVLLYVCIIYFGELKARLK